MNGAYSAGDLRRLRQKITRKRQGKLTRGVLLLQDNAPAHTSQVAMTAATECGFEILPHPSYSTALALSDCFFLSCVCYAFVRVCFNVPCGHLLGKGGPFGFRLWCLTVSLSLSHWYSGSGVVLDCIVS